MRGFYRVTVTTKEPLETRLKADADLGANNRIVWKGWSDGEAWAVNTVKDMLGERGYSIGMIEMVEMATDERAPFIQFGGYPCARR